VDRTITVTGRGRVSVAPDVADVQIGVAVTRPTVADARGVAAREVEAAVTVVFAIA
jgi:uncharacterized protein YggE